jgi:hypothetical protein
MFPEKLLQIQGPTAGQAGDIIDQRDIIGSTPGFSYAEEPCLVHCLLSVVDAAAIEN